MTPNAQKKCEYCGNTTNLFSKISETRKQIKCNNPRCAQYELTINYMSTKASATITAID